MNVRWNKWMGRLWGKRLLSFLLLIVLLLPSLPACTMAKANLRVQPLLLQMAAERPEETVRVIVQKMGKGTSPKDLVP